MILNLFSWNCLTLETAFYSVLFYSVLFYFFITLLQNTSKVDFLLLSETLITKSCYSNNKSLYAVPGYTFIHYERNKGKGGGVGAYISDKITWKRRTDLENDLEAIWIEIFPNKSKSWLLCILY